MSSLLVSVHKNQNDWHKYSVMENITVSFKMGLANGKYHINYGFSSFTQYEISVRKIILICYQEHRFLNNIKLLN